MKTTKQQKDLLVLALATYVQWLNESSLRTGFGVDNDYTVDQFIVNKPKQNLHGWFKILYGTTRSSNADYILHALVHDGDEGGASDLIIGFRNTDWGEKKPRYEVDWIMQGFDGSFHTIVNEGKLVFEE